MYAWENVMLFHCNLIVVTSTANYATCAFMARLSKRDLEGNLNRINAGVTVDVEAFLNMDNAMCNIQKKKRKWQNLHCDRILKLYEVL